MKAKGTWLLDYLRDQVQALLGRWCNALKQIPLIGFGRLIRSQPLHHVQGVGQGYDPVGIYRVHLLHELQDLGQIDGIASLLRIGNGEPRELGDLLNVGTVK